MCIQKMLIHAHQIRVLMEVIAAYLERIIILVAAQVATQESIAIFVN